MKTAVRLDLPFACVIGSDPRWGVIERAREPACPNVIIDPELRG